MLGIIKLFSPKQKEKSNHLFFFFQFINKIFRQSKKIAKGGYIFDTTPEAKRLKLDELK